MKVIQISDTHLFANDELAILGIKSNIQFATVLNKIIQEDIHDTDMIFLTGDISQDETVESYQKIADSLSTLNIHVYWIPGNHDNLERTQSVFLKTKNFHRQSKLSTFNWHFIFLNTKVEGREDGELSQADLEMLNQEIHAVSKDKKIAIVMHHHPAPVGTPLIDQYILKNRNDFWNIVSGTAVELIMCGHVHGDYCFQHNNVTIESSPATCLQWEKGTTNLKIDKRIGYKVYDFDETGYKAVGKLW